LEAGILGSFYNVSVPSYSNNNLDVGTGPGLHFRIGGQFTDLIGAQVEVSGGFIVLAAYARTAIALNLTPVRWFTVSGGPALGYLASVGGSSAYAGITLRANFHVYQRRTASGRRHSLTLGIGGDVGGSFAISDIDAVSGTTVGALLDVGYTLH
jgi:hypothetical protein